MNKLAAFAATYADWKLIRTRKCVQVVFEVPLEAANEAHAALGGMPNPAAEAWFGIARLDVSKVQPAEEAIDTANTATISPSTRSQPASVNLPGRAPNRKVAVLLWSLPAETQFQNYIDVNNTDDAVKYIRAYCRVDSRKHILPETEAEKLFLQLYDEFALWRDVDKYVEAS